MAKEKRDGTKVSYIISNDILKELNEFCEKTGRTRTKVVEMAIRLFIEQHKEDK